MPRHGRAVEQHIDPDLLSQIVSAGQPGIRNKDLLTVPIGRSRINITKETLSSRLDKFERCGFIVHDGDYYRAGSWLTRELAMGMPKQVEDLLDKLGVKKPEPLLPSSDDNGTIDDPLRLIGPIFDKISVGYRRFWENVLKLEKATDVSDAHDLFIELYVRPRLRRLTLAIWRKRAEISPDSLYGQFSAAKTILKSQ